MSKSKNGKVKLSAEAGNALIDILENRFAKNRTRHKELNWAEVQIRLETNPEKLWSLQQMEITGGEPDVVDYDKKTEQFVFYDCSPESPVGRRSFCYDEAALSSRKENKPKNSALGLANEMGVELLNEQEYNYLQTLGNFDTKTSSWIITPTNIRKLGGAIFGDYRYGKVFIYHNGAESYYAARGFRSALKV